MRADKLGAMRRAAVTASLMAALSLAAAPSALAQSKASVSSVGSVSGKVTVKSVDLATRRLVVTRESGETAAMTAPAEARNFEKLKPGDVIAVTYTLETEIVLSAPNTALPSDATTLVGARTKAGQLPGGVLANQIVVTGSVLAVDAANHTLKLVSPQGGEVHTVAVETPEGRAAMAKIKVGDKITAHVTESVLLSVDPA